MTAQTLFWRHEHLFVLFIILKVGTLLTSSNTSAVDRTMIAYHTCKLSGCRPGHSTAISARSMVSKTVSFTIFGIANDQFLDRQSL